jgi:hypothetical protein
MLLVLGLASTIPNTFYTPTARNYDSWALSALRNVCTVQEAYYADHNKYDSRIELSLDEIYPPEDVGTIRVVYANDEHYKIEAFHKQGEHILYLTEEGICDETGRAY